MERSVLKNTKLDEIVTGKTLSREINGQQGMSDSRKRLPPTPEKYVKLITGLVYPSRGKCPADMEQLHNQVMVKFNNYCFSLLIVAESGMYNRKRVSIVSR